MADDAALIRPTLDFRPQSRYASSMLHMLKLAVGVRDVEHLAAIQTANAKANSLLRHRTRNKPKRADEITGGGSIYWVINRAILVRQLVTRIIDDQWEDGSRCAGLVLAPELVPVSPRAMKPFQGWRYLNPADAPADLGATGAASGIETLPYEMRLALTHLALL